MKTIVTGRGAADPPTRRRPQRSIGVLLVAALLSALWSSAGARAEQFGWSSFIPWPQGRANMTFDEARGVAVLCGAHAGGNLPLDTWEWNGSRWHWRANGGPPGAFALAYDSQRHVTVAGNANETWEWDGIAWSLRSASAPAAGPMVFDRLRGVILMFSESQGQTWEWDGATWTLRSTTGPAPRMWSRMAYDTLRNVAVLFGGGTLAGDCLSETWEWDSSTQTWNLRATEGPAARLFHSLVFDSRNGVTVLIGGECRSTAVLTYDSWEWNGSEWSLRPSPPYSLAVGRSQHAAAYDNVRDVLVVFGGEEHIFWDDETWELNEGTWNCLAATGPYQLEYAPWSRSELAMAYDSYRGVSVLFGGRVLYTNRQSAETWEFNGNLWVARQTETLEPRSFHAMAYDSDRRVTLMFGGYLDSINADTSQLLGWDGTTWYASALSEIAVGPAARHSHAMVYDSARHVAVMFGGRTSGGRMGDTWELVAGGWTLKSESGPSPRQGHGMAYDSARGVTVLFGGSTAAGLSGETWEWNGAVWTLRSSSGPSARSGLAMTYDPRRRVTVMFGGNTGALSNETWEWNGTAWTQSFDSVAPTARQDHAMTYQLAQAGTLLFGGSAYDNCPYCQCTWAYGVSIDCFTGDYDADGHVTIAEIPVFVTSLLQAPSSCIADVNGDGAVDGRDVQSFVERLLAG
ncbi:MAG: kelch repeat-containing protein [Phycisphaerae bacterium]